MAWSKLTSREGVDIVTVSGIDRVFWECFQEFRPTDSEVFFTVFEGKTFTHYVNVDAREAGRFLYRNYFGNRDRIRAYERAGKKLLREVRHSASRWKRASPETMQNGFAEAFSEFRRQFDVVCHTFSITSWLSIEAWQKDYEDVLNRLLMGVPDEARGTILECAYRPWKKTALYEILDKLAKGNSPAQVAKEYQFLRSWSVVWYRPLEAHWVESLGTKTKPDRRRITKKRMREWLKPDAEGKAFLNVAPLMVFFKDWRDDLRRRHAYEWTFLFERLARRWGVAYSDVGYLTLDEIEKAIRSGGPPDLDAIRTRKKKAFVVLPDAKTGEIRVLEGKDAEPYLDIAKKVNQGKKDATVRGLVAQKGKATGLVRLIHSYHDIKKVQTGEVLVANTTHPDFLPAMQKACAFVTNEGGMVSHAAIVARELKKPCIVGTKNATAVFSDGDKVEVDADRGIAKKVT